MKDRKKATEAKGNTLLKESLLLSCTTVGRTISSSHAEKSVNWEENRLGQIKTKLDDSLYKCMVKLNSDKLEIVDELVQLRKSRSASSLDSLDKTREKKVQTSRLVNSDGHNGQVDRRRSIDGPELSSSITSLKRLRQKTLAKEQDQRKKISVKMGGDSSEESSDEEKVAMETATCGRHSSGVRRTISVVSCQFGRECGSARSELQKFENASRRYTNQFGGKLTH